MSWLEAVGLAGQAFFFSRFLVQWALSERAGRSLTPRVFWWLSLVGSVVLSFYSLQRDKHILLVGYLINGAIYVRNLQLQYSGRTASVSHGKLVALAVVAGIALVVAGFLNLRTDPEASLAWLVCAGVGQAIWSSRFVVQWWHTERSGESHFPRVFWWLSLLGNILLLAYALRLGYPTYIAGFVPGPLVQVRNLMLGRRKDPARADAG